MFGNEKDAENFFEFLNCQHKSIKFTLEKESNKFLSFLDALIKNEGNCFSTSVYRKKTSVGLFTQFNSFTPISYKIGLVRCLIYRAFKMSSSYIIFNNELEKVKILLQKNMYPKSVIDNQIKTFLDKHFTVDSGTISEKPKTLHYSLLHIGHFSHVTEKKLKHICEGFCKDIDISITFSLIKLSSFFSCKDNLPKSRQSYIVYQFIYAGCKVCYIGETKHHLNTRIEEHFGKNNKSHIYSHLQENTQCQKRVNFDCFEIIDCASSYFRSQIKEAMYINRKKHELNKQVKHVGITITIYVYCSIIVPLSSHFLVSHSSVSLCAYQVLHFNHLSFKFSIVFKVSLTYFDFMISILIVICNHVHYKAFDHVNIGKVFKN